ncbi:membrane protein insertase YidC [Streptomyces sp. NBC_01808]|uniref:membrane protein insertase YidC n=1 Tax=Streptomyces sp. NBC_01808 TaxID=2975947 RepID=UPI002DD7A797|nr:membrane protein insertase YidC [Streptomyces sp. NBC_01808]WSA39051.1 membrane protein insertase YidC [Streptomyces sp. NBC_01808]
MDTVLKPLYIAVSWIIVQFHSLFSLVFDPASGWAWGLSIVALVVVIRIALIPLFVKQIKATRNMQVLQPKMKAIQERYKSDKQRQSEEMMKLYRETGTNPLSSCLPILAQSPFFLALFQVLNKIAGNNEVGVLNASQVAEARQAHVFGAPIAAKFMDSASKVESLGATLADVRVVTVIMIVLMSGSQFYTQRQLMTKNVDLTVKTPFMQQQKMLMYIFPVMFAVFGINFPVGVLIYWLTTNVWSMGQQMYVIKRNPTPGSKSYGHLLERMQKHVIDRGGVRGRRDRYVVKQMVAKGKDRNEDERKFVSALAKHDLLPQADGTIVKSETPLADAKPGGGDPGRRQQPKRQSKSQRRSHAQSGGSGQQQEDADGAAEPEDKKPASSAAKKKAGGSSGRGGAGGNARNGKSGQRKGPQRPKHPSKK